MLNQSAEYALRATLFIAHRGSQSAYKATAISDALSLPANYLSKIMHELVRAHVLKSVRGPTGGYSLAVPATQLTLDRIIAPFQDVDPDTQCLLGDRPCDKSNPCAAHQRWGGIKEHFASHLRNTTLAALLTPLSDEDTNTLTLTEVA